MENDCFVLGAVAKNIFKESKNLDDLFDFSDLTENYEPFNK